MEPDVQAVVDKISARYLSRDTALDKCSIACGQLIVELEAIGVTEVQQIEVSEPSPSRRSGFVALVGLFAGYVLILEKVVYGDPLHTRRDIRHFCHHR